jgi:hypothetical protein
VSSEWQRQNIDRYRDAQLKWKYGISKADYNQLLVEQNGLCQVCRKPRSEKRALAVDHCHATGAIRGLLCDRCNHLLGHARDSVEILRSAIEYLEQHNKRRLEETQ